MCKLLRGKSSQLKWNSCHPPFRAEPLSRMVFVHGALVPRTRRQTKRGMYVLSHRNVVSSNELFRRYSSFWGYNFESKISYHRAAGKNESLEKINTKKNSPEGWNKVERAGLLILWFIPFSAHQKHSRQSRGTVLPPDEGSNPSDNDHGIGRQRVKKWDPLLR